MSPSFSYFSIDIKFLSTLQKSQSTLACYKIYLCFSQRFSIDHHRNTSAYVTQSHLESQNMTTDHKNT
jgi:hypothetical protein